MGRMRGCGVWGPWSTSVLLSVGAVLLCSVRVGGEYVVTMNPVSVSGNAGALGADFTNCSKILDAGAPVHISQPSWAQLQAGLTAMGDNNYEFDWSVTQGSSISGLLAASSILVVDLEPALAEAGLSCSMVAAVVHVSRVELGQLIPRVGDTVSLPNAAIRLVEGRCTIESRAAGLAQGTWVEPAVIARTGDATATCTATPAPACDRMGLPPSEVAAACGLVTQTSSLFDAGNGVLAPLEYNTSTTHCSARLSNLGSFAVDLNATGTTDLGIAVNVTLTHVCTFSVIPGILTSVVNGAGLAGGSGRARIYFSVTLLTNEPPFRGADVAVLLVALAVGLVIAAITIVVALRHKSHSGPADVLTVASAPASIPSGSPMGGISKDVELQTTGADVGAPAAGSSLPGADKAAAGLQGLFTRAELTTLAVRDVPTTALSLALSVSSEVLDVCLDTVSYWTGGRMLRPSWNSATMASFAWMIIVALSYIVSLPLIANTLLLLREAWVKTSSVPDQGPTGQRTFATKAKALLAHARTAVPVTDRAARRRWELATRLLEDLPMFAVTTLYFATSQSMLSSSWTAALSSCKSALMLGRACINGMFAVRLTGKRFMPTKALEDAKSVAAMLQGRSEDLPYVGCVSVAVEPAEDSAAAFRDPAPTESAMRPDQHGITVPLPLPPTSLDAQLASLRVLARSHRSAGNCACCCGCWCSCWTILCATLSVTAVVLVLLSLGSQGAFAGLFAQGLSTVATTKFFDIALPLALVAGACGLFVFVWGLVMFCCCHCCVGTDRVEAHNGGCCGACCGIVRIVYALVALLLLFVIEVAYMGAFAQYGLPAVVQVVASLMTSSANHQMAVDAVSTMFTAGGIEASFHVAPILSVALCTGGALWAAASHWREARARWTLLERVADMPKLVSLEDVKKASGQPEQKTKGSPAPFGAEAA